MNPPEFTEATSVPPFRLSVPVPVVPLRPTKGVFNVTPLRLYVSLPVPAPPMKTPPAAARRNPGIGVQRDASAVLINRVIPRAADVAHRENRTIFKNQLRRATDVGRANTRTKYADLEGCESAFDGIGAGTEVIRAVAKTSDAEPCTVDNRTARLIQHPRAAGEIVFVSGNVKVVIADNRCAADVHRRAISKGRRNLGSDVWKTNHA